MFGYLISKDCKKLSIKNREDISMNIVTWILCKILFKIFKIIPKLKYFSYKFIISKLQVTVFFKYIKACQLY